MHVETSPRDVALRLAGRHDIAVYPKGVPWQYATSDVDDLNEFDVPDSAPWYARTQGKFRLAVLDIPTLFDRIHIEAQLGPIPKTWVSSRGYGEHFWFRTSRHAPWLPTKKQLLLTGAKFLSQAPIPGSLKRGTEDRYYWITGPDDCLLACLPDSFFTAFDSPASDSITSRVVEMPEFNPRNHLDQYEDDWN